MGGTHCAQRNLFSAHANTIAPASQGKTGSQLSRITLGQGDIVRLTISTTRLFVIGTKLAAVVMVMMSEVIGLHGPSCLHKTSPSTNLKATQVCRFTSRELSAALTCGKQPPSQVHPQMCSSHWVHLCIVPCTPRTPSALRSQSAPLRPPPYNPRLHGL